MFIQLERLKVLFHFSEWFPLVNFTFKLPKVHKGSLNDAFGKNQQIFHGRGIYFLEESLLEKMAIENHELSEIN